MKYFKIARFIELYGYKIITAAGLVVILFSGLVFYLYGLRTVNDPQTANLESTAVDQTELKETLEGLEARLTEQNRLKNKPLSPSDIFR